MGAGHAHALYVHEHSVVHRLPAEVKLVATFLFVLGVALTPRYALWAFALDAAAVVTVGRLARVRASFVLARMSVIVPFVLAGLLVPFVAGGEHVDVLGIALSREGLWGTVNVVAKASIGAATSILLAATTEVPRLLRGLERLRVPPVLTQIATMMVRYLEVIAGEVTRTRTAMTARGHDPRWLWQSRALASASGSLFVRSYERGERVHAAMLARGYTGTMPRLDAAVPARRDWWAAAGLPAISLTAAAVAAWTLA